MTSYTLTCPWCERTIFTETDAQRVAPLLQVVARLLWLHHVAMDHPELEMSRCETC